MEIKTNLSGIITSENEENKENLAQNDFKENNRIIGKKQFFVIMGLCLLCLALGAGGAFLFLSKNNSDNNNTAVIENNDIEEDDFSLQVKSIPKNASVYINNNSFSSYTPADLAGLSDGSYLLQLFLDDKKWEANIEIEANKLKSIGAVIPENAGEKDSQGQEDEEITYLFVTTNPSGARIFLNDKDTEKTSPANFINLDGENYVLEIQRNGYVRWRQNINLKKGDNIQINALLEKKSVELDDLLDDLNELDLAEQEEEMDEEMPPPIDSADILLEEHKYIDE